MRYFLTLSYLGKNYSGWQRQPNAVSVQEKIEEALATALRERIEITGCGRTDTGVHARDYVAHFDTNAPLPDSLLHSLNGILPADVAIHAIRPVHDEAHARFDAFERSYEYQISFQKDPFSTETAWFFPQGERLDIEKMQEVANLLPRYDAFFPFCKSDSGLDTFNCELKRAVWVKHDRPPQLVFHITANRFLRGMVRLIVGACVNVGLGKLSPDDVRQALDTQTPLRRSLSVPPQGLCLTTIKYPF